MQIFAVKIMQVSDYSINTNICNNEKYRHTNIHTHIHIHVKRHTHKKMQSRYCAEIFAIITYLALYLLTQTSNCS